VIYGMSGGIEGIQDKLQSEHYVSARIRTRHFSNTADELALDLLGYSTSGPRIIIPRLRQ